MRQLSKVQLNTRTSVTEHMGKPSKLAEVSCAGNLIYFTRYQSCAGMPARTSKDRHGADSSQISSPGFRPHSLIILSSEVVRINIYDAFGKKDIVLCIKLLSKMQLQVRTSVSQFME